MPPNIANLLVSRELGLGKRCGTSPSSIMDKDLGIWADSAFLHKCSSQYVDFNPSPRSTIAAAFSADGKWLASTHGDHTVKLTQVSTGKLVRTLQGHRRTPWVVRFHPTSKDILASGSLDWNVIIWRASTGESLYTWNSGKPIASLAFSPVGSLLTVATGHKVYNWQYRTDTPPTPVLKTRRSLRALHFHPVAGNILLTAEVTERKGGPTEPPSQPAAPPTQAPHATPSSAHGTSNHAAAAQQHQSVGYPQTALDDLSAFIRSTNNAPPEQDITWHTNELSSPSHDQPSSQGSGWHVINRLRGLFHSTPRTSPSPMHTPSASASHATAHAAAATAGSPRASTHAAASSALPVLVPSELVRQQRLGGGVTHAIPLVLQPNSAEAYSLSWGWESSSRLSTEDIARLRQDALVAAPRLPSADNHDTPCIVTMKLWEYEGKGAELKQELLSVPRVVLCSEMGVNFSRCGRYMACCAMADKPSQACVEWYQQQLHPQDPSSSSSMAMSTPPPPHAMRGERQPAGFKNRTGSVERQSAQAAADPMTTSTDSDDSSPSQNIYELRVYSISAGPAVPNSQGQTPLTLGDDFGRLICARPIQAAHCMTSIQFSPTGSHLLVAYGRRHISLCSLVADGGRLMAVHSILEVYSVPDLSLVRVLPSIEDEVNVACFNPWPGGGMAYGTKEGKLRILRHDRRKPQRSAIPFLAQAGHIDDELWEAEHQNSRGSMSESDAEY